jgi:hypothetical protein
LLGAQNLSTKVRKSLQKDKNRKRCGMMNIPEIVIGGNISVGGDYSQSSRRPITKIFFSLQTHHHLSHYFKEEFLSPSLFILPIPESLSCLRLHQCLDFLFFFIAYI